MKEDDERDRKELGELVEKLQKYAPEHANREMTIEEYYQLKLGYVPLISVCRDSLVISLFSSLVKSGFEFLKSFINLV